MPFPNCSGCSSNLSALDALTVTASHELCEAITDPIPGQEWYDNQNGEIGDICAWQTKKIGQYTVQKEWSNQPGRAQWTALAKLLSVQEKNAIMWKRSA